MPLTKGVTGATIIPRVAASYQIMFAPETIMSDTFGLMPLQKVCDANAVGGAGTTGAFEIVTDADPWVIRVLSAIFLTLNI